jgi:predicted MFS family arabinose efflux permease
MPEPIVPSSHAIAAARRPAFVGLLFAAMGAATLPVSAIGILATFIIDDTGITRSQLGWIVSTNVILGAAMSPVAGRVTDAIGGRKAILLLFGFSATAFVVFGAAPAIGFLFVASAIAAFAQAAGNPSTNLLIRTHLGEGTRGVATGIKQSGVHGAVTLAGIVLPSAAIAVGWRPTMAALAVFPAVGSLVAWVIVPRSGRKQVETPRARFRLSRSVRWLAAYGLTFGFAGAVMFYVPLYVEEALGFDPRIAGLVAASIGATAVASRILWARWSERHNRYLGPLWLMAIGGIVAAAAMALATSAAVLVWPAAFLIGATSAAWNSVGMLAVINNTGVATGRSSGIVLLGFLIGFGIGPPIYGATIDATGGYTTMWIISLFAAALSALVITLWRRAIPEIWDLEPGVTDLPPHTSTTG